MAQTSGKERQNLFGKPRHLLFNDVVRVAGHAGE